jgi:hypothetical protein
LQSLIDKWLPLKQEIIFASTGVKKAGDPPWKYVEAFVLRERRPWRSAVAGID